MPTADDIVAETLAGFQRCEVTLPLGTRGCLFNWVVAELNDATNELFGQRFSRAQSQLRQPPSAFLPRWVTTPTGEVFAGIRFKGGDATFPFVRVMGWVGAPPLTPAALAALHTEFAAFDPVAMFLYWPGDARPHSAAQADQHHLLERLEQLRAHPKPWTQLSVDVRRTVSLDAYPEFEQAFSHWQQRVGPRGDEVWPATRADLESCVATGALVSVWQGSEWCGWMGARRGAHAFADGYEVMELFLMPAVRGKRRAAAVQRRLIDTLVDHGRDVLWGTIHASNRPSLKTALRCGRRIVRTSWFIDFRT
ncbi:MAG: GNAT superfamily N-acetyltransferase [Myxococcota bacterium]|jgi:GNAT superfamily N-acetyltransferase